MPAACFVPHKAYKACKGVYCIRFERVLFFSILLSKRSNFTVIVLQRIWERAYHMSSLEYMQLISFLTYGMRPSGCMSSFIVTALVSNLSSACTLCSSVAKVTLSLCPNVVEVAYSEPFRFWNR